MTTVSNEPKIFNDQGFITKEATSFINDGFIKELHRVVDTGKSINDIDIINGLLKNIVDNHCSKVKFEMNKVIPAPAFKVIQGGKKT